MTHLRITCYDGLTGLESEKLKVRKCFAFEGTLGKASKFLRNENAVMFQTTFELFILVS
jgi:hypothetical protein